MLSRTLDIHHIQRFLILLFVLGQQVGSYQQRWYTSNILDQTPQIFVVRADLFDHRETDPDMLFSSSPLCYDSEIFPGHATSSQQPRCGFLSTRGWKLILFLRLQCQEHSCSGL